MADPFDISTADPSAPGLLGQSPSFWQNLASFGGNLSAAANARTADGHLANGADFAGALGPAINATMDAGRQRAVTRSNLASQAANTQGQVLQNQLAASGLPLAQARNALLSKFYNDPNMMSSLFGGGAGPAPAMPASSAAPGAIPQDQRGAILSAAVSGTPVPPQLANALIEQESGWNPGAKGNGGSFGLTQPLASTAAQPGFGMQPIGQDALADPVQNARFGVQYLYNRGKAAGLTDADWNDPNKVGVALAAYHSGVDNPRYVSQVQARMQPGQAAPAAPAAQAAAPQGQQGPQGSVSPLAQRALATAQQYESQANQIEIARSLGLPVGGDPAALRQAAQQYRQLGLAGAEQAEKSANTSIDLRSGGMHWDPAKGWIKNPVVEQTMDQNGNQVPMHVTPPLPGSPPGTPGEATPIVGPGGKPVITKLPQNVQDARNKAYEDFTGKDTDSYIAAQHVHGWLEQMDHAADTLNTDGGFLGTGPTSPARLGFANNVNDILRTAGLPEAFDANKLASWEELKKATTTAGFELSSHYEGHARQAAQTIMNATSAVPSSQNTPVGFHLVSAGIREAAQSAIDVHEFKQNVYNQQGDLGRAEVDFYKQNPEQMYARRAISSVTPYPVKSPNDFTRYLPGTIIKLPNGQFSMVPNRAGAPPIPSYMGQYLQTQQGIPQQ